MFCHEKNGVKSRFFICGAFTFLGSLWCVDGAEMVWYGYKKIAYHHDKQFLLTLK